MMLVKTYPGDGVVELYEAYDDIRYLDASCRTEAPVGDTSWSDADRALYPEAHIVHDAYGRGAQARMTVGEIEGAERQIVLAGWCQWRDRDGRLHLLIHDGRTFLMNADGETVEVLA